MRETNVTTQPERLKSSGLSAQATDHSGVPVIEINDVSFSYDTQNALEHITLAVPQGDYLGMIGPNGAGKTTLLKIMLGLLKPAHGSVRLFGQDIRQFSDWPKIGYVPQKVTNFDVHFPVTVEEVALMGRYGRAGLLQRMSQKDRDIVKIVLEQVGMWDYRDRLIGDLSGGQQQRVFIARALATQPEIIFLDEPTTGIDRAAQDEFYALLKKLNREMHLTLVLISHDVERVTHEAKHIACIDTRLVCHGLPEEFLKDSRFSGMRTGDVQIITHTHQHP